MPYRNSAAHRIRTVQANHDTMMSLSSPSNPEVILKPLDESDLDFWQRLTSQPETREHQPVPDRSVDELLQQFPRYSERDLSHPTHLTYKWVVLDRETGEKVGIVSFDKIDLEHRIGRIGYTISREFWGRGYGTAAVTELIRRIFTESETERIEAECSIHNPASVRVLEKNGFGLEGIKRGYLEIRHERVDHFSFGLLKSDWGGSN
ncbi:MAG: GNAT family N-acetyltransferase [Fidelibacterota bacterium]